MPFDFTQEPDISLVNAENFAKWAEQQEKLKSPHSGQNFSEHCAVSQFAKSMGFPKASTATTFWTPDGACETIYHSAWVMAVVNAYDKGERRGPVLAEIARSKA